MKIVQLGKYYWPYCRGIETYLKLLCERICNKVNLEVLVTNDKNKTISENINGVKVTRLARLFELASTSFCYSLPRFLRKSKADIVHVHLPNPWAELSWFLAGKPGKLVVSFHSDIVKQKFLLQLHKPLHKAFLNNASAIIVASPAHISGSPFLSKMNPDKFHVIPYGINPDDFKLNADDITPIKNETTTILFVGHLVYYKGLDILIKALKQTDCNLIVAGTGPLEHKLKDLAQKLELNQRISFLAKVEQDELVKLYNQADIFCLPSTYRSEAFGIVQLEAFAASKPVISTNLNSGVPFVNQDRQSGIIVPPSDINALADAINELANDCDLRSKMGKYAYQRLLKDFTADKMANDTLKLYQDLL